MSFLSWKTLWSENLGNTGWIAFWEITTSLKNLFASKQAAVGLMVLRKFSSRKFDEGLNLVILLEVIDATFGHSFDRKYKYRTY